MLKIVEKNADKGRPQSRICHYMIPSGFQLLGIRSLMKNVRKILALV